MMQKSQKKILMFFVYIFGQGGAERVILNILNYINNDKYDIHLILGENNADHQYLKLLRNTKVKIDYLGIKLGNDKDASLALAKKINLYHPDVLITEAKYTSSLAYQAKKLSRNRHVKLIFREANTRSVSEPQILKTKIKTFFQYNFGAKKIICVSQGVADDLIKNYKIFPHKIVVIYNPADLKYISKKSREVISENKFKDVTRKKIINVGRLVPAKNQRLLIDAFNRLPDNNASLFIVGIGDLENDLKAYCKKQNIRHVHFLGYSDNPHKYIRSSDIYVSSSLREGLSNVIIEALAIGTPVIATDCPSGTKEIIGKNEFGILVPNNNVEALTNSIHSLLNNKCLLKKYSKLGKKRSKDFDATNAVKQYENIIDDI